MMIPAAGIKNIIQVWESRKDVASSIVLANTDAQKPTTSPTSMPNRTHLKLASKCCATRLALSLKSKSIFMLYSPGSSQPEKTSHLGASPLYMAGVICTCLPYIMTTSSKATYSSAQVLIDIVSSNYKAII